MEKKRILIPLFSLFLAFSPVSPALADTVSLFDGSSYRGIITKQDENTVVLKTSSGEMAFQKGRVQRISFDDNDAKDQGPVRKVRKSRTYAHKEPLLACCVSGLIPGLGQLYNGDVTGGMLCLGSYCLSGLLAYTNSTITPDPNPPATGFATSYSLSSVAAVFWGLSFAIGLYSMFEAYNSAAEINSNLSDDEATLSRVLLSEGIRN
ncbi:MAG TPA: hypothetical protein DD435_07605 [Cyanobacteria bacterium UBA8530]|nr:hypothetical protein [Cyanobacteria bacterium UBA8530]